MTKRHYFLIAIVWLALFDYFGIINLWAEQ